MIHTKKITTTILSAAALSSSTFAGEVVTSPTPEPFNNGSFCDGFKTVGKFYSDKSNPYIQELKFFGRLHYQVAQIDGDDVNGDSFSENFDEFRRLRFGAQIKFLNGFTLKGNINLVDDDANSGGDREFAYQSFDELTLGYTFQDVAGFDKLTFKYGRHKVAVGAEAHVSSKKIKTVERAAITNRIFNNRYTGFKVEFEREGWEGILGYFSLDDNDALGSLDNFGSALYLSTRHDVAGGSLLFDFFYNLDADGFGEDDEVGVGYEWAASLAYETKISNWDLLINIIYGDNGDEEFAGADRDGNFWGLIIMPSTYLIEDKLEFVARYSYQGSSEDEGIRTNSRFFRDAATGADINGGRGDQHHSIYAGLNYHFCGHNSKVLLGVEYENLDTPVGDADATTLWAAYRIFF